MFPGLRLSHTGITAVQFRCDLITNSWLINGIAAPIVEEGEREIVALLFRVRDERCLVLCALWISFLCSQEERS